MNTRSIKDRLEKLIIETPDQLLTSRYIAKKLNITPSQAAGLLKGLVQ